jgi:hypothetical protein
VDLYAGGSGFEIFLVRVVNTQITYRFYLFPPSELLTDRMSRLLTIAMLEIFAGSDVVIVPFMSPTCAVEAAYLRTLAMRKRISRF